MNAPFNFLLRSQGILLHTNFNTKSNFVAYLNYLFCKSFCLKIHQKLSRESQTQRNFFLNYALSIALFNYIEPHSLFWTAEVYIELVIKNLPHVQFKSRSGSKRCGWLSMLVLAYLIMENLLTFFWGFTLSFFVNLSTIGVYM